MTWTTSFVQNVLGDRMTGAGTAHSGDAARLRLGWPPTTGLRRADLKDWLSTVAE